MAITSESLNISLSAFDDVGTHYELETGTYNCLISYKVKTVGDKNVK